MARLQKTGFFLCHTESVSMALIEINDLTKEYPGVTALDGVCLSIQEAEIHGIIGENGAGKSTLMKILSGVEVLTRGSISLESKPARFHSVKDAEDAGIVMIHQELNLAEDMTVAENIFLGRELSQFGIINQKEQERQSQQLLDRISATIKPGTKVRDLSIAQKQQVEIARAIGCKAKVVIMDEPTAVLTSREVEALFRVVQELKDQGVTVIYISHILEELILICDRITVLRDGHFVDTVEAKSVTPADLAHKMVGRELGELFPIKGPQVEAQPILEGKNLSVEGFVKDISFSVAPGQILGFAGLIGSGRTELFEAIIGIRNLSQGNVLVNGKQVKIDSPSHALNYGIAYLSEDRKARGLHLLLSIRENIVLANLKKYSKFTIQSARVDQAAEKWRSDLQIKLARLDDQVSSLSGGNQQKVCLAKWLDTNPQILILDEPTRGVDIGAKAEIYNLIHRLASEGMAVVVISSEMLELIGLCHDVIVLRSGSAEGSLHGDEITEQNMMELAAGVRGDSQ